MFVLAAAGKLIDREGSRRAVRDFGTPERIAPTLAALLPPVELAVAGLLLFDATARYGAIGAAALLLAFCVAIASSLARGRSPDCHCFGSLHSEPAGGLTLGRNVALLAAAVLVAVAGWDDPGSSAVGWLGDLETAEAGFLAGGLAAAGLAIGGTAVLVKLLRAYGRVLLRLERLERRLAEEGIVVPFDEDELPELGLPVGSAAPDVALPALGGGEVMLSGLAATGKPIVLLFTDPDCGPCRELAPRVARWQAEHDAALTLAVISHGKPGSVHALAGEHGWRDVLVDSDGEAYAAYGGAGTPSAVLVDPELTIASPLATGSDQIERLVEEAARGQFSAARQVFSREQGLAVGDPAPTPMLAGPNGSRVELGHLLGGSQTLVLFWNPDCGFCQAMLGDLRTWEKAPPAEAPRLVVLSSENGGSSAAGDFSSPVLIDADFAASGAFGARGTPMAVLVDGERRIASPLASGADEIMALARPAHNARLFSLGARDS